MKLPLFSVPQPNDINKQFMMDEFLDKDKAVLEWASTEDIPEELQGHERVYDDSDGEELDTIPHLAWTKQYTIPKENMAMDKYNQRSFIHARRYRMHKNVKGK